MSGGGLDNMEFVNLFLDSNIGWGADLDHSDFVTFSNIRVWNNGVGVAGTGGIRLTRNGGTGSAQRCQFIGGYFDDNTGTGLLLDDVTGTIVADVSFVSRALSGGSASKGTTGIQIGPTARGTSIRATGSSSIYTGQFIVDESGSARIDLGSVRTILPSRTWESSTTLTNMASIPVGVGEKWLVQGVIVLDGPMGGDFKIRLQASSATGATGWIGLTNAPTTPATDVTATFFTPNAVSAVAVSGGGAPAFGTLGVGIRQIVGFTGYVEISTVAGTLQLQMAPNSTSTGITTLAAGSWMEATRVA